MDEICRQTQCDRAEARAYYEQFNQRTDKAIKAIKEAVIVVATGKTSVPKRTIGFGLWFERADGSVFTSHRRTDIFISAADFDYILAIFKAHGPDYFYRTSTNYYTNAQADRIATALREQETDDPAVQDFMQKVAAWMALYLPTAETLVVGGNL